MQSPRVVVITGASGGVGRATVQAFAKRGAHIGPLARGQAGLEAAARQVEETFGPIDVWVNVGFVTVFAEFKNITSAEFRRVTEVTYLGYVHGTLAALKRMLPRDRGKWRAFSPRWPCAT